MTMATTSLWKWTSTRRRSSRLYLRRFSLLGLSLQWRHENGGLWSVKVRLQYNDGSKTDRYVGSAFFGDSKEGLHLVRAYTKRIDAQMVLKYSESRALQSVSKASARDFD